jgi:hypothetical protein
MLNKYSAIMESYLYNTKSEALQEIFNIENIFSRWTSKKISSYQFLEIIAKPVYSLKDDTGLAAQTISDLNKKFFVGKPNNMKVCTFILDKYDLKYCPSCTHVYSTDSFHYNESKSTSRQAYCKQCFNSRVKDTRKEYEAHRRADKLNATPSWADYNEIKKIYRLCPVGKHVDHFVPLKGMLVCGLHVEHNLKYLNALDNITKSNSFDIDTYIHTIEYVPPYTPG